MSLFLSTQERETISRLRSTDPVMSGMYWSLQNRVEERAMSPDLAGPGTTTQWWHHAAEYLTDAAMALAVSFKPSEAVAAWVRGITLNLVRRPIADWIGPSFRDHTRQPPMGHLETAHLSWAVAVALDLVPHVFSSSEQEESRSTLREKGLALCLNWLDHGRAAHNWRCILLAGTAVAAAVLEDSAALERAAQEYIRCSDFFEPDGSYGESLQYGNYAFFGLMLTREALVRRDPSLEEKLPLGPGYRKTVWDAHSFLYKKPLTGWGAYPIARSVNFNDSAATYRPTADVLLHIAARARQKYPVEAGLARWLFDTLYLCADDTMPQDRATFGLVNRAGFLSMPLWPQATAAISPAEADLPTTTGFSCGDAFARDAWNGRTVLAVRTGGDIPRAAGHAHHDRNSFILVHNRERLLADPGHSCYRNLIHDLEIQTATHNTCTFTLNGRLIQQSPPPRAVPGEPLPRSGTQRLLVARNGQVCAIGSEVAAAYGVPLRTFERFWILCGAHALFIVDKIESTEPVRTTWNFLLNNRDGQLGLKQPADDRLVARRGDAGMKLFHLGGGRTRPPRYAYVHDAYHPLPDQLGEGRPGSGLLVQWTEPQDATSRTVIHAIAMDDSATIAGWHLKESSAGLAVLESPDAGQVWRLEVQHDPLVMSLSESVSGALYRIEPSRDGSWQLNRA